MKLTPIKIAYSSPPSGRTNSSRGSSQGYPRSLRKGPGTALMWVLLWFCRYPVQSRKRTRRINKLNSCRRRRGDENCFPHAMRGGKKLPEKASIFHSARFCFTVTMRMNNQRLKIPSFNRNQWKNYFIKTRKRCENCVWSHVMRSFPTILIQLKCSLPSLVNKQVTQL